MNKKSVLVKANSIGVLTYFINVIGGVLLLICRINHGFFLTCVLSSVLLFVFNIFLNTKKMRLVSPKVEEKKMDLRSLGAIVIDSCAVGIGYYLLVKCNSMGYFNLLSPIAFVILMIPLLLTNKRIQKKLLEESNK